MVVKISPLGGLLLSIGRRVQDMFEHRPLVLRFGIAMGAVLGALALAWFIPSQADPSHYTFFFLAVMLGTWYGGFIVGLFSTIVSAISLDYFFIAPLESVELDWRALLRLIVFIVVAAITSYLTSSRKRAEIALQNAQLELEDRVRQRTSELAKANNALRSEIVERQKADKALLQLQSEMGRVERLATLGKMAGTIAHDLGTPLNSVLGYAQLIAQEDLTERARRRLAIIESQINRMGEIIQSYLSHAREAPRRVTVNINDLIHDTLVVLQPYFQQRGIVITANLGDRLPMLHADGSSLQRVLMNLLDNAVDACGPEGGRIQITTKERPAGTKNDPGVTIEIADNGVGIPAEVLPRLFDLFVTTKTAGKGTGLGLVICQEIIKAHGGTIDISSRVGVGTTVSFYLPIDATSELNSMSEGENERSHNDRG